MDSAILSTFSWKLYDPRNVTHFEHFGCPVCSVLKSCRGDMSQGFSLSLLCAQMSSQVPKFGIEWFNMNRYSVVNSVCSLKSTEFGTQPYTRFCWAYECNDQSEEFRWVQGALADWIPWRILSSETTKCRSAYDARYQFHSSNSFRNYNGSFWDWSLDDEIITFFDNVM